MEFTSGLFFTVDGIDGFNNDVVQCLINDSIIYHMCFRWNIIKSKVIAKW